MTSPPPLDDLGDPVGVAGPAVRVVSLVPSLTESVALTRPDALVGATDWCTHPAGLDVPRVRGTKNPNLAAIADLKPDLVLANQEENRRVDVERLRAAGVPVWVTVIRTLDEAMASLRRMFGVALGWPEPEWLADAERAWRPEPSRDPVSAGEPVTRGEPVTSGVPAPTGEPVTRGEPVIAGEPVTAVIPIWRDPWMVVGSGTFTGDLAVRLGLRNVYGDHPGRYPKADLADIIARRPGLVVLPDEPYEFSESDGPEMFPDQRVALVEGRSLTWYGPSLVTARARLLSQLSAARPPLR